MIRPAFAAPLLALAAFAFSPAHAHDYRAGELRIVHPWAAPTPPGARVAGVWLKSIANTGSAPDRLLRASTPAAGRVEIHTMRMEGDVMRMREIGELPLPPGSRVEMRPRAGEHLMLMELRTPLKAGDSFPLTLEFERAGRIEVRVDVEAPRGGAGAAGHAHGAGEGHGHGAGDGHGHGTAAAR